VTGYSIDDFSVVVWLLLSAMAGFSGGVSILVAWSSSSHSAAYYGWW
jgi:hypothetical protein